MIKNLPAFICLSALTLAFFTQSACRINREEEPEVIWNLPPEFKVDLYEQFDPQNGQRTLGLWVESIETYTCKQATINAQSQLEGHNIQIQLKGINLPEPCDPGSATPVRQFIPIGQLADGTYHFSLSIGANSLAISEGMLQVSATECSLDLDSQQGADFQNILLHRIPADIIWGYILKPNDGLEAATDAFISDLKGISTEHGLIPGFYGYFSIGGTGLADLHKSVLPAVNKELFVRQLNASPQDLKNVLQQYRTATQSPLEIKCWTTKGEQ